MNDKVNRLLMKINCGDLKALEMLYDELKGSVYAFCLSILKDKFSAEDMMQETFVKLWQSAHSHKTDKSGRSWIFTIAHNLCYDRLRADGRAHQSLELNENGLWQTMVTDLNLNIELRDALSTLDEAACRILLLHLAAELKFREIAALLGLKRTAVEWQYYSAIKKLGAYYEPDSQALKGVT